MFFEVPGREIAERGVAARGIVEAFDEVEDGHAGLGVGLEAMPVEKLAFERRKEAFAHRIVVSVAN